MKLQYFGTYSHGNGTMHFYGSAPTGELLKEVTNVSAVFHEVTPFESFEAAGHQVTPLPGMHAPELKPMMYLIEKDGKTLFYAHDTGIFKE